MYAARLAAALRERTGAQLFGMGGPRMAEAGVELIADYHEVAVVGIAEVLHKIPTVVRVQNRIAKEAAKRGAIPGDSGRFARDPPGRGRRLKNHGIPVGYFIGPQVWAWRAGRVRVVKRLVKRMVVIFPFEEKIYRDAGVPVDFVGHPLVDVVQADDDSEQFAARHGLDASRPIVTLLPGSRRSEIAQHYPRVLEACERLNRSTGLQGVQFVHAIAPNLKPEILPVCAAGADVITRVKGETYDALAAADCAIVASGTATVEAALLGTPMVVIYRVTPLSLRRSCGT